MNVKQEYTDEAVKTLMQMHPEYTKEQLTKAVDHIVKLRFKDPSIYMDNNVTGDNANISLSRLCGWIKKENPVISGNATFYKQPKIQLSPTSKMLKNLKLGRKQVKKKMFNYKPGSDEYAALDLDQQNKKVIMNAEYGGSGTPTAAFYTKYSPAATTLMAQSIITTMAAFFEGYVGDNHKFFSSNECFDWMNTVIKKDAKVHDWIVIPNKDQVKRQVKKHFITLTPADNISVDRYIDNCNDTELVYLYYTNNFKDLIRNHKQIQQLLHNVLSDLPNYEAAVNKVPKEFESQFADSDDPVLSYNRWISEEMFLNPYNIPDVIKDNMERFIAIMNQYVYVEYITPDSIIKLNNHLRNTVLLVDTDSNMINADLFVAFVISEIFNEETFGRDKMYNEMILVNVLAATIDRSVASMLDYYGRCHNMDEESRAELTMKNEFMFRRFFLMKTKKRYAASIVLREGNIIIPFKPEIKGMDFIKAGVTDDVSNRFKKILCDHILFSKDLELHEMMDELKQFEREIYDDLKQGGTTYLKQQQYKAAGGYKDAIKAWSLPVFRGSAVWNEIFPDKKIYSLDRVKILKLKITKVQDLDIIKDAYPREYQTCVNEIFNSKDANIRKTGLKVICIPNSVKTIPEWIIPLIDIDLIISDVISSFRSVLESLNIEDISFKTANGNASLTSCLIAI